VSDIERGRRNIGFLNLQRLGQALEIDMPAFMAEFEASRQSN
jgi:transcriptional regulator with XRE-family HTH domain